MLGRDTFFKRSASFYLHDAGFIRLHSLSSAPFAAYELFVDVRVKNKLVVRGHRIDTNAIQTGAPWTVRGYSFGFLDARFNLSALLPSTSSFANLSTDVDIRVKVRDANTNKSTGRELRVEAKLLLGNFEAKRSAMVCAKCFYLSNERDLLSFRWWLELNKRSGYEHVSFCNQSIEASADFKRMFYTGENAHYLSVNDLTCVPNLQDMSDSKPFYFTAFSSLEEHANGLVSMDIYKIEVINQLVVNECYLRHVDKYKYIAVLDNDETIVPKKIAMLSTHDVERYLVQHTRNLTLDSDVAALKKAVFDDIKCDRYDDKQNKTPSRRRRRRSSSNSDALLAYVDELKRTLSLGEKRTVYFGQTFFVPNEFLIELSKALDTVFLVNGTNTTASPNNYNSSYSVSFEALDVAYSFAIRSRDEHEYAHALWILCKRVIAPFYAEHAQTFAKLVKNYDRFFVLSGELNDISWGKSVHDTRKTFDFSIHHAQRHIVTDEATGSIAIHHDGRYLDREAAVYGWVPYEYGYESHFRHKLHHTFKDVSIRFVRFDPNYLNCFFRPILDQMVEQQQRHQQKKRR